MVGKRSFRKPRKISAEIRKRNRTGKVFKEPRFDEWPPYILPSLRVNSVRREFYEFGERFIQNFVPSFNSRKNKKYKTDFLRGHGESPLAVAVCTGERIHENLAICLAKIGFTKESVLVKGIQGEKGKLSDIMKFENIVGMKWANYLIQEIEVQAKQNGYRYVKITIPERIAFYQKPSVHKSQYYNDIIEPLMASESQAERKEGQRLHKELQEEIRQRMRKLYYGVAKEMGYKKRGDYFIKKI
ncbi:MAG: hypothetical protein Q7S21_00965 [archaeon]|nr:hypothetical protein [archaeon]